MSDIFSRLTGKPRPPKIFRRLGHNTAFMQQVDFTDIVKTSIVCKFCGSDDVTKYGFKGGVQQFWCKNCERKFMANNALPGMRFPPEQIATALSQYYEGLSLNAIRRQVENEHNVLPSDSTVYEWVVRFTKQAVDAMRGVVASVGDTWVVDETVLRLDKQNAWFWDVIDDETRFLLGSHLSLARTKQDAIDVLRDAAQTAHKLPKYILSDGLRAYPDAVEQLFGADTKHVRASPFTGDIHTNAIERFHGTIKQRTKVMRGMQNLETARLVMDGWLIHYNFIRPHESLDNKTPGEVAKVAYPFKTWREVVTHGHIPTERKRTIRL